MSGCSYAACVKASATTLDGWSFCQGHADLHAEETVGSARVVTPQVQRVYPRTSTARCGTPAGYDRHRREKTAVCPACRLARRTYLQQWKETRAA